MGAYCANNALFGAFIISKCYSEGHIYGNAAGGIAGGYFGEEVKLGFTLYVKDVYSTGNVVANFSGGIIGAGLGFKSYTGVL